MFTRGTGFFSSLLLDGEFISIERQMFFYTYRYSWDRIFYLYLLVRRWYFSLFLLLFAEFILIVKQTDFFYAFSWDSSPMIESTLSSAVRNKLFLTIVNVLILQHFTLVNERNPVIQCLLLYEQDFSLLFPRRRQLNFSVNICCTCIYSPLPFSVLLLAQHQILR